jgi:acyl-ACP thioesterase
MAKVFPYTYQVQAMDIGFRSSIRVTRLGTYLLHAAGLNADENGFGLEALQSGERTWVLSRLAMEMNRYPVLGDVFTIETWIEDIGRVFTSRNFRVLDASGAVMGGGASVWCLLDTVRRSAVNLQQMEQFTSYATGVPAEVAKAIRVPSVHSEPVSRHRIKYSDIDFNRHTNSMKYLEWMMDLFPMETYLQQQVRRVDLNYHNEALFGDVIDLCRENPEQDRFVFHLKRGETDICRAQILFENVG